MRGLWGWMLSSRNKEISSVSGAKREQDSGSGLTGNWRDKQGATYARHITHLVKFTICSTCNGKILNTFN